MSNRDIRNLVGLCSFYVEFVSHRFAPSVFAVRFHWNHKFPSNVWQQFREWRFFSNLAMAPSSRFVLGVPRERLAMGVIEFWSNSSSSFLHRCLCTVAFQPFLLSYGDNFSSSFLCLVSLLLVSKVSFAIDGKHNVRFCLWRPQGVFSHSHVTLT